MHKIKQIRATELKVKKSPIDLYKHFSNQPYSALLTGKGKSDNSHYSFIGIDPFYISEPKADPFNEFHILLNHFSVKKYRYPANLWGGIGYFSYDACHFIEKLPKTNPNELKMPVIQMVFYQNMIIFDHHKNKTYLIQVDLGKGFKNFEIPDCKVGDFTVKGKLKYDSESTYIKKVNKIKDYIIEGDVYEVNLSHKCTANYKGDTFTIFNKLYNLNSAPFSAYLPFGDHIIMSNSPERFILAEKDRLETRPIKGTLPRSKSKTILKNSKKDEAELSMIVDLMRNDFGKVCKYGSVKVKEHKRIEGYKNVWQMLSIIEGRLRPKENYGTLMRACFPGGSITGCPKIRSMEIIDEIEDSTRNLYTGSIFIANDVRMDSSIVIRTIIAHKNKLTFNVGGAIVYDSDPKSEYQETLDKAENIMQILNLTV
jgi:para-aminobenzoate synthetase component 1